MTAKLAQVSSRSYFEGVWEGVPQGAEPPDVGASPRLPAGGSARGCGAAEPRRAAARARRRLRRRAAHGGDRACGLRRGRAWTSPRSRCDARASSTPSLDVRLVKADEAWPLAGRELRRGVGGGDDRARRRHRRLAFAGAPRAALAAAACCSARPRTGACRCSRWRCRRGAWTSTSTRARIICASTRGARSRSCSPTSASSGSTCARPAACPARAHAARVGRALALLTTLRAASAQARWPAGRRLRYGCADVPSGLACPRRAFSLRRVRARGAAAARVAGVRRAASRAAALAARRRRAPPARSRSRSRSLPGCPGRSLRARPTRGSGRSPLPARARAARGLRVRSYSPSVSHVCGLEGCRRTARCSVARASAGLPPACCTADSVNSACAESGSRETAVCAEDSAARGSRAELRQRLLGGVGRALGLPLRPRGQQRADDDRRGDADAQRPERARVQPGAQLRALPGVARRAHDHRRLAVRPDAGRAAAASPASRGRSCRRSAAARGRPASRRTAAPRTRCRARTRSSRRASGCRRRRRGRAC